jgi:hypothetical protein
MADQIKPRYRLGTQNMLDLAKDDATKIPERTLFKANLHFRPEPGDRIVVRTTARGFYDWPKGVAFDDIEDNARYYFVAQHLQPLI